MQAISPSCPPPSPRWSSDQRLAVKQHLESLAAPQQQPRLFDMYESFIENNTGQARWQRGGQGCLCVGGVGPAAGCRVVEQEGVGLLGWCQGGGAGGWRAAGVVPGWRGGGGLGVQVRGEHQSTGERGPHLPALLPCPPVLMPPCTHAPLYSCPPVLTPPCTHAPVLTPPCPSTHAPLYTCPPVLTPPCTRTHAPHHTCLDCLPFPPHSPSIVTLTAPPPQQYLVP